MKIWKKFPKIISNRASKNNSPEMATDYVKPQKEFPSSRRGKEFESLIMKNIPNWHAIWSMMLEECKEFSSKIHERPINLEEKIERKIIELVEKENTLVDLYQEAAEYAKRTEEEFNMKTAILMQQIEKDKNLMKMLKHSC